ncbi:MAG: thiamine diphosphokinase, partial [Proteobacteria bacterium]|nr:thiamine diphosphokinase [Pseudomonadota bacterium]
LTPTDRLRGQVAGSRVIAADGGIRHASALGLDVELWVGDFDSTDRDLAACHGHVERQVHPAAKDKTDGEIAIDEALKRGAREIMLVGGLGGQSDHALGNIMLALGLARDGIRVVLSSGGEEAWPLLPGALALDIPPASRMSIVALSDLVGLSLTGVEWPLDDRMVKSGSSLTLSNTVVGPLEITLGQGYGVVVTYPG